MAFLDGVRKDRRPEPVELALPPDLGPEKMGAEPLTHVAVKDLHPWSHHAIWNYEPPLLLGPHGSMSPAGIRLPYANTGTIGGLFFQATLTAL